ncbi:MAG TPA: hypothetical protein DD473_09805 [Planctomycetaceae bacterium]|nr:hypothetical protein [Planctomycetaceae bacterium]
MSDIFSVVQCPGCEKSLKIKMSTAHRRVRCRSCKCIFSISVQSDESELRQEAVDNSGMELSNFWLNLFGGILILGAVSLLLNFALGPIAAITLFLLTGFVALSFWKPALVLQGLNFTTQFVNNIRNRVRLQEKEIDSTFHSATANKPPVVEKNFSPENRSSTFNEDLVEIQPASHPNSRQSGFIIRRSEVKHSLWSKNADANVRFLGTDGYLDHCGVITASPLVYFLKGKTRDPFDASLIESDLKVATSGRGSSDLPYWPSYRECSPSQRRNYLAWLESGRKDPNTELGYVFIHFYGLERRALVDQKDHSLVIQEVLRLLPIYGFSNSFKRYATDLLWACLINHPELQELPLSVLNQVIESTPYWSEDSKAAMLAIFAMRGEALPPSAALIVAQHDARSPRSVIIQRHKDRFTELFKTRFNEKYPSGMPLKSAKREYRLEYRPASATLSGYRGDSSPFTFKLPNISGIPSQFKTLLEIWNSAIEDLRAFDRAHKKADSGEITADMYEKLPLELREGDHPQFDRWYSLIQQFSNESGWCLIPVGELAELQGIDKRSKLTKKQCSDLLQTADCMDLCLEPDSRESGQTYHWDSYVSIFPREDSTEGNLNSYHAASILLRLGMSIAAADGVVDDMELKSITSHLEQYFELSPQESIRLEHLAYLLSVHPDKYTKLGKQLKALPEVRREAIGEYLIAIAAADGIITEEEVSSLKKAYKSLDLEPSRIEELSAGNIAPEESEDSSVDLLLDQDRIREILQETKQVSDYLKDVMLEDGTDTESDQMEATGNESRISAESQKKTEAVATINELDHQVNVKDEQIHDGGESQAESLKYDGLPSRFHPFLEKIMTRNEWTRSELDQLAREHSLMLNGTIESINEWSLEVCGDWLIDDQEDRIVVTQNLFLSEKST